MEFSKPVGIEEPISLAKAIKGAYLDIQTNKTGVEMVYFLYRLFDDVYFVMEYSNKNNLQEEFKYLILDRSRQ
ncbi:MAG: hypothetical protein AMQ22_01280 [Candidatus Methanofastidiosum methylothiophilum]|uniref:Uncharacterized protein n=1 Tax=Candidatus Methanofastidiosum methylothiophilum TaxID=1705564 RepID=A0A150J309_9EURY|nr:MAG: hypothetical protein AMQ22_01280 [Candidatus Methanofastidiosum methylthiophilus]